MKNEIIIYQAEELTTKLEVRIEDDTVWLTQLQMVDLFNSTKQNISLHISNIFREEELDYNSTVKEYLTVQNEGGRNVKRKIKLYNLDVIISVGYRVKSQRGTQFRIWANGVLKEYMLKGYAVNQRIDHLEHEMHYVKNKLGAIDFQIKTSLPPNEGIFFDGQIFDAYSFVSKLIKSAKSRIVLIDNYVDESVLTLLSKRKKNIPASIFSSHVTKQLQLDLQKHNHQYPPIALYEFSKSHDRFLITDEVVYHFGASLKDLGKKWFAFSKMEMSPKEILDKIKPKLSSK